MAAVIFICPMTDLSVQSWLDDDDSQANEAILCPACAKVHLIDRRTGEPLSRKEKRRKRLH